MSGAAYQDYCDPGPVLQPAVIDALIRPARIFRLGIFRTAPRPITLHVSPGAASRCAGRQTISIPGLSGQNRTGLLEGGRAIRSRRIRSSSPWATSARRSRPRVDGRHSHRRLKGRPVAARRWEDPGCAWNPLGRGDPPHQRRVLASTRASMPRVPLPSEMTGKDAAAYEGWPSAWTWSRSASSVGARSRGPADRHRQSPSGIPSREAGRPEAIEVLDRILGVATR